jgi:hypothetical protein
MKELLTALVKEYNKLDIQKLEREKEIYLFLMTDNSYENDFILYKIQLINEIIRKKKKNQ